MGGEAGGTPGGPSPQSPDEMIVFREDDASFKERLRETLVNHWLINTFATLVLFILVFWYLAGDLLVGLLAGVLVLVVSNLHNVMWRIRDFERWEIFSNGVKLGYDPGGQLKFVRFSDIVGLEERRGLAGSVLVMDLGSRKLRFPYRHNREVFDLIKRKYSAFQSLQMSKGDL